MRIRIIQKPDPECVDGVRVDRFEPGYQYEIGTILASLFLAEGWAEPVPFDEPDMVVPFAEADPFTPRPRPNPKDPPNLVRESYPPSIERLALAGDYRWRKRPR